MRITVDQNATKMSLELVAALDFESQTESKRELTMKGWWEELVGGAVFSQPGNRKNSKLEPNQSRRVLQAFKPALKESFYNKVFMYLSVELGSIDLKQNFSCSWNQVVAAFDRALGDDCKAKCIDSFLAEAANIVGGESVETHCSKSTPWWIGCSTPWTKTTTMRTGSNNATRK